VCVCVGDIFRVHTYNTCFLSPNFNTHRDDKNFDIKFPGRRKRNRYRRRRDRARTDSDSGREQDSGESRHGINRPRRVHTRGFTAGIARFIIVFILLFYEKPLFDRSMIVMSTAIPNN